MLQIYMIIGKKGMRMPYNLFDCIIFASLKMNTKL